MHVAQEEAKNAEDQRKAQEMEVSIWRYHNLAYLVVLTLFQAMHIAQEEAKNAEHKAAADEMGKSLNQLTT